MLRTVLPFLTLATLAFPAAAQDDCRLADIFATDGQAVDWFGDAVAVDGTTAVIGARFDDDAGVNSGSAYVFVYASGAWTLEIKLTAGDAEAGDFFGDSVAISGDTIVVGARFEDEAAVNAGAAYVFKKTGGVWAQEGKLLAADGAADDRLGVAVALVGDRIALGSETNDGAALNGGAVYVFERTASVWFQTAKLTALSANQDDFLGACVALSGDRLIAGANGNDLAGVGAGSVVVFEIAGGTWSETQTLLADDPRVQGRFGDCVAIEGDTLVVGAPLDDDGVVNSGSVYVFEHELGAWTRVAKLRAPSPAVGDEFGAAVALQSGSVIIGAPMQDDHAANAGNLYQFENNSGAWAFSSAVLVNGLSAGDQLGRAVALGGRFLLAGAPFEDTQAFDAGFVCSFFHPGARRAYGAGVAGTNGVVTLATSGCIAGESMQELHFANGPLSGVGLLIVGGVEVAVPFAGGLLLVGPNPFINIPIALDAAGSFTMPFMATETFFGRSLFMQAGFLDAGAPSNIALSAALEIAFR